MKFIIISWYTLVISLKKMGPVAIHQETAHHCQTSKECYSLPWKEWGIFSALYSNVTFFNVSPNVKVWFINKGKSATIYLNTFLQVKLHLLKKHDEKQLVQLCHKTMSYMGSALVLSQLYSCETSWTGLITAIDKYLSTFQDFSLHCTLLNGIFYEFLSVRLQLIQYVEKNIGII